MTVELPTEIFTNPDGRQYHLEKTIYTEEKISGRVAELGSEISKDYEGKDVVMIGILKGGAMLLTDLARRTDIKNGTLEFDTMGVESYDGTNSTGKPKITKDISSSVEGKHVIIVEDIIDTGYSLEALLDILTAKGAASVEICSLLSKPSRREVEISVKYLGFTIPNMFVVGYFMDYLEKFRNLPFIAELVWEDEVTSQNPSQEA